MFRNDVIFIFKKKKKIWKFKYRHLDVFQNDFLWLWNGKLGQAILGMMPMSFLARMFHNSVRCIIVQPNKYLESLKARSSQDVFSLLQGTFSDTILYLALLTKYMMPGWGIGKGVGNTPFQSVSGLGDREGEGSTPLQSAFFCFIYCCLQFMSTVHDLSHVENKITYMVKLNWQKNSIAMQIFLPLCMVGIIGKCFYLVL